MSIETTSHRKRWLDLCHQARESLQSLPAALSEILIANWASIGTPEVGPGQFFVFDGDLSPRILDYPAWIARDLGHEEDRDVERDIFLAGLFWGASMLIEDMILDASPQCPPDYVPLVRLLSQRGDRYLANVWDHSWSYIGEVWHERADAGLCLRREHFRKATLFTERDLYFAGARWAPAKALVAAVIHRFGYAEKLDSAVALVHPANRLALVRRDLKNIRGDADAGNYSYPIVQALHASNLLSSVPLSVDRTIGAVVLSGTIPAIADKAAEDAEMWAARARESEWPSFGAYFDSLANDFRETAALFPFRKKIAAAPVSSSTPDGPKPEIIPVGRALTMAKAAILWDPSFRDSWEVHRWGFLDRPLIVARRYPVGVILENLAEAGNDVSAEVDALITDYCDSGFLYLDPAENRAAEAFPPEIDTLGLMLRLLRYSRQRDALLRRMEKPLGWLGRAPRVNGALPLYLLEGVDRAEWAKHFSAMIGMACDGATAGSLLGLVRIMPDLPAECANLLRTEGLALAGRVERFGVGGCSFYRAEYLCYMLSTLAAGIGAPAAEPLRQAAAALIECTSQRMRLSPQEAAFLTMACHALGQPPAPEWKNVILGGQRHDGTWEPEPLYITAFTGGTQLWHSGRILTTSYCYRALCV